MSDPTHPGDAPAPDPSDTVLEEPSTEKEPGEEPRAPEPGEEPHTPEPREDEPSHHAVGIGIIDAEEPEGPGDDVT